jgi:hypothetical protein
VEGWNVRIREALDLRVLGRLDMVISMRWHLPAYESRLWQDSVTSVPQAKRVVNLVGE